MSNSDIRKETEELFSTAFTAAHPSVPISYENIDFTPTSGQPWVRISIRTQESTRRNIGSSVKNYDFSGNVFVQIFAPLGEGLGDAYAIADTVDEIFRNVETEHIRFRSPSASPVGESSSWYQVNATVPFRAYFLK
ncbi:phage tail terminator-like protein [uncultured Roseibium sp.]|uniref:phage tail terminator-like protein n=1 Tax=uncultured Roseibium sp. TaxID=1936171 RepID=UPI003417F290